MAESFSGAQVVMIEAVRKDVVTRKDETRPVVQERDRIRMERERRLL